MHETCTDDIRRDRRESSNSRDCASILVAQRVRQFFVVLYFHIAKAEQRLRTVIS